MKENLQEAIRRYDKACTEKMEALKVLKETRNEYFKFKYGLKEGEVCLYKGESIKIKRFESSEYSTSIYYYKKKKNGSWGVREYAIYPYSDFHIVEVEDQKKIKTT